MNEIKTLQSVWHDRMEEYVRKNPLDARSPGDIDYARIIHSASFRRLQGKTQILNLGDSDFYRTRLTHSLEVAQIAGGIASQLPKVSENQAALEVIPARSMMQAIACTHDLGHPPFGHGGEVALNYCMRDHGGFEGNGQTLRILSKLEKFSDAAGSNLTRETLLGVLKYPVSYSAACNPDAARPTMVASEDGTRILDRKASKPPKCYLDEEQNVVDWMFENLSQADRDLFQEVDSRPEKHHSAKHKSFACSIMDLADDISYGVHDLEDVLALGLVAREHFEEFITREKCEGMLAYLTKHEGEDANEAYENFVHALFSDGKGRKRLISRILNYVIPSLRILEESDFQEPRLRFRASMTEDAHRFVSALKDFVREAVIFSPSVQHLEFKGQSMVIAVFEVLLSDPEKFLPRDIYSMASVADSPHRSICDYVAGMTDTYLMRTYERLFSPRAGSVFDKL